MENTLPCKLTYRLHADDYGISVNAAKETIQLIEQEALTSVSVMVNMAESELCASMLLPYKEKILASVHLNILEGQCCCDSKDIGMLVDINGNFKLSWMDILMKSGSKTFRKQLKLEFTSQINRYCQMMGIEEGEALRLDSHQHIHMVPGVFRTLCQLAEESKYRMEYIRMVREPMSPFICSISLWGTYKPVNIIKNIVCNLFCLFNYRMVKRTNLHTDYFFGLIYSGNIQADLTYKILNRFYNNLNKANAEIEIAFHPGTVLENEKVPAMNLKFESWHCCENRRNEWNECKNLANQLLLQEGRAFSLKKKFKFE